MPDGVHGGRVAKSLRSLTVFKEFPAKNSCLVGLQYRPRRPIVRPDEQVTAAYKKICQKAEQELLQILIHQQQKNSSTDAETISSLKQHLSQMFPDQSKREKAENRIQSATNRSLARTSLSQKRPAANRKKQPKEKNELSTIKAKFNPLTTEGALRALIDFTLSNARRFYSSMGKPLDGKGLTN